MVQHLLCSLYLQSEDEKACRNITFFCTTAEHRCTGLFRTGNNQYINSLRCFSEYLDVAVCATRGAVCATDGHIRPFLAGVYFDHEEDNIQHFTARNDGQLR